jgi:hypothetical protein
LAIISIALKGEIQIRHQVSAIFRLGLDQLHKDANESPVSGAFVADRESEKVLQ